MSLLTTKLHAPPARPGLVPRPALIERLQESLRRKRKLTLFSAPAGFGKTTLIAEWVNATAYKLAWVSLDEGDSDPVQFLQYLVAALQSIDAEFGQALLQVLRTPRLPSVKNLIAPLINEINTTGQDIILVLDDYHTITAPKIHEIIEFLFTLLLVRDQMQNILNEINDSPFGGLLYLCNCGISINIQKRDKGGRLPVNHYKGILDTSIGKNGDSPN